MSRPAFAAALLGVLTTAAASGVERPVAPREPVVLNDDGGWCWFQDERAIVAAGRLVVGTVAAGRHDPSRRGAVEATAVDLLSGGITRTRLDESPLGKPGSYDDHDAPAFVVRGDGRLLVVFAGHGSEERFHLRVSSRPGDPSAWGEERTFAPSPSSRVTYSNLARLSSEHGRIYDFFRGKDDSFKPSLAWSDDDGESWTAGRVVIDVPSAVRHRPYVKYVGNGEDTIHLVYTEGHPRDYDNSLYHVLYRNGRLHRSDGTVIRELTSGLRDPAEGTRIFRGDAANVAWPADLELDRGGRPFAAYSVQKDSAGLPPGQGGTDLRYRLARWTGTRWDDSEIAFAGTRLYAGEDDYPGGVALVPGDPSTVIVSTNADPATGRPLVSRADGRRHWEICRGHVDGDGRSWRWQPLTRDSGVDNIRPVVPNADGRDPIVIWLRGRYRAYTDYDLEVVALLPARP